MMKVTKTCTAEIQHADMSIVRELIILGLQRLEEVDKPSWGDMYKITKDWGNDFLQRTNTGD